MATEITNMAVFCDFENVALGVRDANYAKFDIDKVLERLLLKGNIVVRKAYCDWDRYKAFKRAMHEASFELIEIPHVRQSGKNSADIRMVVDALDLCYTKAHLDTFVLLTGDSDFSPLVAKLRENAKTVIGVGVKQSTSDLLINICDEFIYYDDLVREQPPGRGRTPRGRSGTPRRTGPVRPGENGYGNTVQPMVGPPLPLHESLRGSGRAAPRDRQDEAPSGAAPGAAPALAIETSVDEPVIAPVIAAGLEPGLDAGEVGPGATPAATDTEGDAAVEPAPRGRARAKGTRARAGSRRTVAAIAEGAAEVPAVVDAVVDAAVDAASGVGSAASAAGEADATQVVPDAPVVKARARRPRAGSKAALAAAAELVEVAAAAQAEPVPAAPAPSRRGRAAAGAGSNPAAIHPADPVGSDGADKAQQAIDLVLATVEALVAERGEEERIWGSMVKQTLKRRNPGFNESYYGFRTFSELLEEAQARRLLELTRDEKSGGFILRLTHHED
jgi:uncharacterized protein (TIGR00288 family)